MTNKCLVEWCPAPVRFRGRCRKHYYEFARQTPIATASIRWSLSARIGWNTGPREANGCRLWLGTVDEDGYAVIRNGCRGTHVTRILLGLSPGDPRMAMHSCDTPGCVERGHLLIGTAKDNYDDCARKGRVSRGSAHPHAKLTEDAVRAIRAAGLDADKIALAKQFGVARCTVSQVLHGRVWKHVLD